MPLRRMLQQPFSITDHCRLVSGGWMNGWILDQSYLLVLVALDGSLIAARLPWGYTQPLLHAKPHACCLKELQRDIKKEESRQGRITVFAVPWTARNLELRQINFPADAALASGFSM
ncbi:hypothetical protein H0G86_003521 [Trichoderma simmonsii]|uniref:Uncharacterized protein n=1 Tax=Trichoderma simmonsii TaxID=1491479 RepID=A0A8G0L8S0_9HYPO|nr:hypothetical protein H0G86_003521 [Trichoderma simmonsii]